MSFPARFGRYEVFRILLPGYYAFTLLVFSSLIIESTSEIVYEAIVKGVFIFSFLIGGIFFGLLIYAYNYPIKVDFYTDNNEYEIISQHILNLFCNNCEDKCNNLMNNIHEAIPTYFYIQYNLFDPNSQNVIQYFRSVYRVFENIILLSKLMYSLEIFLSLMTLIYCILFKPNITIFYNQVIPHFIYAIIMLGVHYLLLKYNKGREYLREIIRFQTNYITIETKKIKEKICVN